MNKRDLGMAVLLVAAGLVGLIASFVLLSEKIHLLKTPNAQLSCNINPIISCGSVIQSKQAEAFGFANPIIGLISFAVIITIGMGMLAGAKYKRWFWLGLEAGTIFGVIFVHWLFYQAVFNIQALCPFCMVVWVVTIVLFVYVTFYNLSNKYISVPAKLISYVEVGDKYQWAIVVFWVLLIAGVILNQFWFYWKTLI
jgi:uncharacterized membrane protein